MRLNGETKTLKDPVALSDFLTQEEKDGCYTHLCASC